MKITKRIDWTHSIPSEHIITTCEDWAKMTYPSQSLVWLDKPKRVFRVAGRTIAAVTSIGRVEFWECEISEPVSDSAGNLAMFFDDSGPASSDY